MLKIRPAQVAAFEHVSETAFEDRIVGFLLERYPALEVQISAGRKTVKDLDPEDFRVMVQTGVLRAREYGMTRETSLTSFVMLMFVIAPNFDEHPQIRLILNNSKINPEERIDLICQQANDGMWEAARQLYNIKAWKFKTQAVEEGIT